MIQESFNAFMFIDYVLIDGHPRPLVYKLNRYGKWTIYINEQELQSINWDNVSELTNCVGEVTQAKFQDKTLDVKAFAQEIYKDVLFLTSYPEFFNYVNQYDDVVLICLQQDVQYFKESISPRIQIKGAFCEQTIREPRKFTTAATSKQSMMMNEMKQLITAYKTRFQALVDKYGFCVVETFTYSQFLKDLEMH